jgi:uncharacterized protein (TIGR02391 family)
MSRQDVADDDRDLEVDLAETRVQLGIIADMSQAEAGMCLLRAMAVSRRGDWSANDLRAFASASVHDQTPRRSGIRTRNYDPLLASIISDALAWLISNALVGPDATSSGGGAHYTVTSAGREAIARGTTAHVDATRRLHVDLHARLEKAARPNFERGEYEAAVFIAMKEVEVALRDAARLGPDAIGTGLVTEAMKAGGPFAISGVVPAEQVAFMNLFQGALGAFKNPSSHRAVEYDDPAEAADVIHLADLLLRIIDRERGRAR